MISYSDFSQTLVPDLALNTARAQITAKKNVTPLGESNLKLGSYQGLQIKYFIPANMYFRERTYVVGRRLYTLTTLSPSPEDAVDLEKFFSSFALTAP